MHSGCVSYMYGILKSPIFRCFQYFRGSVIGSPLYNMYFCGGILSRLTRRKESWQAIANWDQIGKLWQTEKLFFSMMKCCIFRPEFGSCAPQTLVEICIFNVFNGKKLKWEKKQETCSKFNKKMLVGCFIPRLNRKPV